jgi:hypothetical protein
MNGEIGMVIEYICPQMTRMHADKENGFEQEHIPMNRDSLLFKNPESASICVNLRAIPDSVAVGRAGLPCHSSLLKYATERRVGARSLHYFLGNHESCRPGALTGPVFQQADGTAKAEAMRNWACRAEALQRRAASCNVTVLPK